MQRVDIDDVEPTSFGDDDLDCRMLTEPLGTSDLAINRYALEPGETFSGGLHTHLDQEEVFYVVEGTATFETKPDPDADSETVEVGAGEARVPVPPARFEVAGQGPATQFAPGEFQQGRNESDDTVVALALGGPKESTEVRIPLTCRECGNETLAVSFADDGMRYECPKCGTPADL